MVTQFTAHPNDYLIWAHYDAVQVPVLLLRGVESDLVLPETTTEMRRRGPGALGLFKHIQVPGCGHAPALNAPDQLEWVMQFISAHAATGKIRPDN
jgi:pimeloyl-ACP methyl ester carboxylesterase